MLLLIEKDDGGFFFGSCKWNLYDVLKQTNKTTKYTNKQEYPSKTMHWEELQKI